jgi:hypothetical protein
MSNSSLESTSAGDSFLIYIFFKYSVANVKKSTVSSFLLEWAGGVKIYSLLFSSGFIIGLPFGRLICITHVLSPLYPKSQYFIQG